MTTLTNQPLSLNPDLDIDEIRSRFADHHRVQIADFLTAASAKALHAELAGSHDWRHIINSRQQIYEISRDNFAAMPAVERRRLDAAILAEAAYGFQFQYDVIRVPDGRRDRAAATGRLVELACLLSQQHTRNVLMEITGCEPVSFADAQATLYRPGDFLTRHNDEVSGKGRRLAYVLSLSPEWRPEWGGLLLFGDSRSGMIEAIAPKFNGLSLFTVPQPHSVSVVAPYAPALRLSVTGWLRSGVAPA